MSREDVLTVESSILLPRNVLCLKAPYDKTVRFKAAKCCQPIVISPAIDFP